MPERRRFIVLAIAAAAAHTAGCAVPPAHAAPGRLVELRVVDRSHGDAPLAEHHHRGTTWVAGRPGGGYAVRLTNRTGARMLVVLSVDGVNAITGETAATSQAGYVLAPWQTTDITGWRKSDAEAAAFYFTALPDSYAARTGRPDHVGVIGAAVFREREAPPRPVPFEPVPWGSSSGPRGDGAATQTERAERRSHDSGSHDSGNAAAKSAAEPPSASADAALSGQREAAAGAPRPRSERLGTGHGEREYAPVTRTAFERASAHAAEVVQVRYDSERNLVARGVIPRSVGRWVPDPFPGYVPDPPRW